MGHEVTAAVSSTRFDERYSLTFGETAPEWTVNSYMANIERGLDFVKHCMCQRASEHSIDWSLTVLWMCCITYRADFNFLFFSAVLINFYDSHTNIELFWYQLWILDPKPLSWAGIQILSS